MVYNHITMQLKLPLNMNVGLILTCTAHKEC